MSLIGRVFALATVIVQKYGPAFPGFEIAGAELAAINERKRKPVGKNGAKLFHEIKRETGASRPVTVHHDRFKTSTILSGDIKENPCTHANGNAWFVPERNPKSDSCVSSPLKK